MSDLESRLDRIAQNALAKTLAPSLSIAAVKDGDAGYAKAFGNATPSSVYNIASVTKQFVAACVLLVARDGKLSLDDRVSKWFPELTRADEITMRHLLSHTSGYPDYYPLGFPDEEKLHAAEPREIVRRYAMDALQFEPGSMWSYSNTGYHIAGLILEQVTGMPFGTLLTERVLQPAGMTASFFNDPPRHTQQHVRGYTRFALGPERAAEGERAGWMYSSGGIASTARDLAQWHTVLMNGTLLSSDEAGEMTRAFPLTTGKPADMALGWFVEKRGPYDIIQHSGGLSGFVSQTIVSLEHRSSVIVLSNGDHVPVGAIASQLFEAVLPGAAPPVPAAVPDVTHACDVARKWIEAFGAGTVEKNALQPEFTEYLTDERMSDARSGFSQCGPIAGLDPIAKGERGGMSWYRVRVTFASRRTDVVFRETGDGKLAEFTAYPLPLPLDPAIE